MSIYNSKKRSRTFATLASTGAIVGSTMTGVFADEQSSSANLNAKLTNLVDQAKEIGLVVTIKGSQQYESLDNATTDIENQEKSIKSAIAEVETAHKSVSELIEKAKQQNIQFNGKVTVDIDPLNSDDVRNKLAELSTKLTTIITERDSATKKLDEVIKQAQLNKVDVSIKGTKIVSFNQLNDELNATILKIKTAETTQKEKLNQYQQALKDWEQTVKDGKAAVELKYQNALKEWEKTVSDGRAKVEAENTAALQSWESMVADGKAKLEKEYQDALNAWQKSVDEIKASIENEYQRELEKAESEYQSELTKRQTKQSDVDKQLTDAITHAKSNNVHVTIADTKIVSFDEVTKELENTLNAIRKSEESQKEKLSAYQTALKTWEQTVRDGKAAIESKYQNDLKKWETDVANGKSKVDADNARALKEWEQTVAAGKAKIENDYQNALTAWQKTVNDGHARVEKEYQDALTVWQKKVNDSKAKVESDYQKELQAFNLEVQKVNEYNANIRKQNQQVESNFTNAKAVISTNSTANSNPDGSYTQTIKGVVRANVPTVGNVLIEPMTGVTLVSAELVAPSGSKHVLTVTNNRIDFSGPLSESGEYRVNYTFKSSQNRDTSVKGLFTVISSATQGKGVGNATFTTKAPITTNVTNESKPTILDIVLDFSSSYRYKIFDSIDQAKMLINDALTNENSKVIIQAYNYNNTTSYGVQNGDTVGYSTTLLTKKEALSILDKLKELAKRQPSLGSSDAMGYNEYFAAIGKTFGDKNYTDPTAATPIIPFEDVVRKFITPTDIVSVIQFTDGWNGGASANGVTAPVENIDFTFAEWAKFRAKTFMSVINKNVTKASEGASDQDTNSEQSIKDMTRVGHPNIYDMTGKDKATINKELLAKFKETAIEKVTSTKGENQTVTVTLGGSGVTVTKATLKGPVSKELPIQEGKVNFTEKLPDGAYSLEFEATGKGTLSSSITIDGKSVVSNTHPITGGVEGSTTSDTKTDTFKSVEKGNILPEKPVPTNKPVKKEPKPIDKPIKGVYLEPAKPTKGTYIEPKKPTPAVYMAPEKPIKGIYKEPAKPVAPTDGSLVIKGLKIDTNIEKRKVSRKVKELPKKPIKGEYVEPKKPELKTYIEPENPIKEEYKEPIKPVEPLNEKVEIEKLQVSTETPELKVKDMDAHTVSVKPKEVPKELPKTGEASSMMPFYGVGLLVSSMFTGLFKKRSRKKS